MKKKVETFNNAQLTHPLTTDQWHSRLKTCICAEVGHFQHMTEIHLCRQTKK